MHKRQTLILFAKKPKLCRVKTRMWPALSHRECLYLHRNTVKHLAEKVAKSKKFNFKLYTTQLPFDGHHYPTSLQRGIDLGARMYNAINHELKFSDKVIIIGSDCVNINAELIEYAFSLIETKQDLLLCPANDGGYVLLGLSKINPRLFHDVNWGTPSALKETKNNAEKLGYQIKTLSSMIDVDQIEDLYELKENNILPLWANCLLK